MAYVITEVTAGLPLITTTGSTQAVPLGTIVRAKDNTLGAGEFIYLKGVGSTVVGSLVVYDPNQLTTTLAPNTANLTNPVAVAMSANIANQYGWYQIAGVASIKKTATRVSPASAIYLSGTAGRVMATAASGKQLQNTVSVNSATVATATSTVLVLINRPACQGRVS